MVKLLIVKASMALWKCAISISDMLKPSTWKALAIVQGLFAVLAFCAYGAWSRSEPEIPALHIADVTRPSAIALEVGVPKMIGLNPEAYGPGEHSTGYLAGNNFDPTTAVWFEWNTKSSLVSSKHAVTGPLGTVADDDSSLKRTGFVVGGAPFAFSGRTERLSSFNELSFSGLQSLQDRSPIVAQIAPPLQMSFMQKLQGVVLLIQGIILTIGSLFASIFGWIGYRRGRADLMLKELQVRELQLRVAKMERDQEKELQVVAESRIVICS